MNLFSVRGEDKAENAILIFPAFSSVPNYSQIFLPVIMTGNEILPS